MSPPLIGQHSEINMDDTHDLASPLFSKHADLDGIATGDTSYNISSSINEILHGEAFG